MPTQRRLLHVACRCLLYSVVIFCYVMARDVDATYVSVEHTPVRYSEVTPNEAKPAVDDSDSTAWSLTPGQTTGHFTAEFNQPYAVSDTENIT